MKQLNRVSIRVTISIRLSAIGSKPDGTVISGSTQLWAVLVDDGTVMSVVGCGEDGAESNVCLQKNCKLDLQWKKRIWE